MEAQGLLFSEPSIAETGVWCSLADGIDPAQWAGICRFIGSRSKVEFDAIVKMAEGRVGLGAVYVAFDAIGGGGVSGRYSNLDY